MSPRSPIVTLTTDFGLRDPYVAEMKAAILSIARDVQFVDVTHDVAPHDVVEAALALESAARYFPAGTIHVAVVDPGVGTARRGLVLEAHAQRFVGPDNGIFTAFLDGAAWRAFELTASELRRDSVSPTFHGRDVFGPAAGHLARRVPAARFGPRVLDPVTLELFDRRFVAGRIEGAVVHVDRFGNLVTSIRAGDLVRVAAARSLRSEPAGPGAPGGDDRASARGRGRGGELARPAVAVRIGARSLPVVTTYGDLERGQAGALVGSQGRLELAVREGSAATTLDARRGTPVVVSVAERPPGGGTPPRPVRARTGRTRTTRTTRRTRTTTKRRTRPSL
jgi:S-adenosylmethionine hydrolase